MSDISKCAGKGCPLKETCYRYTAPDSQRQAYANFEYLDGWCYYYWEIEEQTTERNSTRRTEYE